MVPRNPGCRFLFCKIASEKKRAIDCDTLCQTPTPLVTHAMDTHTNKAKLLALLSNQILLPFSKTLKTDWNPRNFDNEDRLLLKQNILSVHHDRSVSSALRKHGVIFPCNKWKGEGYRNSTRGHSAPKWLTASGMVSSYNFVIIFVDVTIVAMSQSVINQFVTVIF